uniref:Protein RD3-like n=1 Tax=Haemonchus contortus TaxID=6289 RepID=A0A7I5E564_HAECO
MGPMPKVVEIGKKPRRLRDEICEYVSEFLIVFTHTVLYRFGGYSSVEFRDYSYGGKVATKMCQNDRVVRYCQRSAHLANQAIEKHNLEIYEVAIEDGKRNALICFRVMFRQVPRFLNRKLKSLAVPELCQLKDDLCEVLLELLSLEIPDELNRILEDTPTRLRIRLQLCNEQQKRLFKKTLETKLPQVLLPLTDTVRNEYNQLVFAVFVPSDDSDQ